jgi:hypothetical protein
MGQVQAFLCNLYLKAQQMQVTKFYGHYLIKLWIHRIQNRTYNRQALTQKIRAGSSYEKNFLRAIGKCNMHNLGLAKRQTRAGSLQMCNYNWSVQGDFCARAKKDNGN